MTGVTGRRETARVVEPVKDLRPITEHALRVLGTAFFFHTEQHQQNIPKYQIQLEESNRGQQQIAGNRTVASSK